MARNKIYLAGSFTSYFLFIVLVLMISLFLAFGFMNLFLFYVFFEIRLIPTLILIVGWGYQPERLQVGM